jgi:hypothetical protein
VTVHGLVAKTVESRLVSALGLVVLVAMTERVAPAAPVVPVQESVVAGKLTVRVYSHVLATQGGPLPVWTFVSDGLLAHHQREIRMTVKREPKESPADYPRELLELYRAVYDLAGQGRLVDVGGVTELGNRGLIGRDDFRCLLYTPAQGFDGVPVGAPSLTALIVTCNEAHAAARYGVLRTMARLGAVNRFYPTTPWADRTRKEVIGSDGNAGTILDHVRMVSLDARLRLEDGAHKLVFSLLPRAKAALDDLFAQTPQGPVAMSLLLDPHADGCLVWQPAQARAAAITPPGSKGTALSAAFLVLNSGAQRDSSTMLEDGMAVQLGEASWRKVREALTHGTPLSLPLLEGGRFEIAWVPTTYDDPISGARYEAPGGFEDYKPQHPAPPSTGPVTSTQVMLLTPSDEMESHLSVEALAAFIQQIGAAVTTEASATPVADPTELMVDFAGGGKGKTFRLAFKPTIPTPFADRLQTRLDGLSAPPVRNGPIHFQVVYRINGRPRPAP